MISSYFSQETLMYQGIIKIVKSAGAQGLYRKHTKIRQMPSAKEGLPDFLLSIHRPMRLTE